MKDASSNLVIKYVITSFLKTLVIVHNSYK